MVRHLDFLRAYLADGQDKQAAALFQEFAQVFKGKRQLHWSKGLKTVSPLTNRQMKSFRTRWKNGPYCLTNNRRSMARCTQG